MDPASEPRPARITDRERFLATMHYRPRDRAYLCDFGFWDEVFPLWHAQGLPRWVNRQTSDEFFGMDGFERHWVSEEGSALISRNRLLRAGGLKVGLCPYFEDRVLEDRGETELFQQLDGVRVLRHKTMSSIPPHAGHLLVDRASWNEHYRWRLDPANPDRYPQNWDETIAAWSSPEREHILVLPAGSLYGWLRNWMGVERLSLLVYRDPGLFEELVTTVADCIYGVLRRVLEAGARFDAAAYWEDMCYNAGPLLGPRHFRQFLVPHYRRINALLRQHGIDVIFVDCDGRIDALVPLWLEAGVNCMFPVEVGTWGGDPVRFRREYGRELLLLGGFDKRILAGHGAATPAAARAAIEREVTRLAPLVEEGGYIGFCDHRVPPDVPLANYWHYLQTIRRVWGRDCNLRPLGRLEPAAGRPPAFR